MTAQQQQDHNAAWKRTWVIVSGIGLPIAGMLFWAIVFGTKMVDKLDLVANKQNTQDSTISRMDLRWQNKFNDLEKKVDAIQLWQHDFTLLNPKRRYAQQSQAHLKTGVLMHTYDNSGNVIPGVDRVVANR